MNLEERVTLIIFTSEGREHLLKQSFPSFLKYCNHNFFEIILAIDGKYNLDVVAGVGPDVVLRQFKRKGYIYSIQTALTAVKTPYFFWLEDDFIFNQNVPVDYMFGVMQDTNWAGLFLSRTAPLTPSEKKHHYFDGLYVPDYGFSVSPSFCNTENVRMAFKALFEIPKDNDTRLLGFEPFIDHYFVDNNLKYAVIDPGEVSHVTHIGELESTAREYHMINSVDETASDVDKVFLSGFGKEKAITPYNKFTMLPKLWLSAIVLSFKLLTDRRAYDFAFRIYMAFLRRFKY